MGLSTLAAAYALWLMTFYDDKFVYVIATKQGVAKNIITKIRIMHSLLPSWIKRKCTEDNKLGQKYDNGSSVVAGTSASDAGRSEAISLLILDEAAFVPGMDELWGALQPTLSTGGNVIVLSTPNGVGNWYHETFIKAEEGKNNFYPITLHWTLHPERNQTWRDEQDIELGPRLARQECDGSWLSSGESVIDGDLLEWYKLTYVTNPIEKTGFDKNVWIWEYPGMGRNYMVVADVARGDGSDYSAFHVIDIETATQVVEYQGKIGTREYSNLLIEYATKYNDALLVIENNGIGWATIQGVIDRGYKNLYYTKEKSLYLDNKKTTNFVAHMNRYEKKSIAGFTNSVATRPMLISKLEQYFNDKSVIIKSSRLLNELLTFIWKGGKPEAASDRYSDDLVLSLSIGLWIRDTALKLAENSRKLIKAALDSFKITNETVSPPFMHITNTFNADPHKITIGAGEEIDLRNF